MSPPPTAMEANRREKGTNDRASWSESQTRFFVSILKEYNSPRYRAQNGWTKEAWNSMVQRLNEKFLSANFMVSQLKDKEQRIKKDYNQVKLILSKSGFGWDNDLKMATTIDEKWDELPKELRKWKNKSFPYYDDMHGIYDGKIAEGKHCRRSSEKLYKSELNFLEEDYGQMSTPSPTIPSLQDFLHEVIDLNTQSGFSYDVTQSQYRAMAEEQTAKEAHVASQAKASMEAQIASDDMLRRQKIQSETPVVAVSKKRKRNDTSMDELLALRKQELEAYKELTEKQIQVKLRQIEKNDPSNDPYSMANCMGKLKTLSLPQAELLKAINFLKGDRDAREIFMCCDDVALANAYIKGSISN